MPDIDQLIETAEAPADAPREEIDVRNAGPPEPLQRTLELLPDLDDDVVLVQHNDRVPQFLFPKLEDRGYRYDAIETDDGAVTFIWVD